MIPARCGKIMAVDLGLKTGMALFAEDGRLCWARSHNFGTVTRLKKGVSTLLGQVPGLDLLVLEGGGRLASVWEKEARRRGIGVVLVSADVWRRRFFHPGQRRGKARAKLSAVEAALGIMRRSGVSPALRPRHDAAEAIMAGLWALVELGRIETGPLPGRSGGMKIGLTGC